MSSISGAASSVPGCDAGFLGALDGQSFNSGATQCRSLSTARLDNHDQLAGDLGLDRHVTSNDVILAAYQRWGRQCVTHLRGDFSFVVWDPADASVFGARDPLGVRPFYFAHTGRRLLVATSLGRLIEGRPELSRPNLPFLRDSANGNYGRWTRETAYLGIERLPAGHILTAQLGQVETADYTDFALPDRHLYRTDADYVERFAELLRNSVGARLRDESPVALWVSGGLDSSSIAGIACERAAGRSAAGHRWYSAVYADTPEADEKEFLDAITARCPDVPARRLIADDCWGLGEFGADDGYPVLEPEVGINRALFMRLLRAGRRDGCRAVMTGHWADQILADAAYGQPAVLQDCDVSRWPSELKHFTRTTGHSTLGVIARSLAGRVLRPAPEAPGVSGLSQSARASYRSIRSGTVEAHLAQLQGIAAHASVEWRFPFLDFELVRFLLHVPAGLKFRDGVRKLILREAMAPVLPPSIRHRLGRAHITTLEARGLQREAGRVDNLLTESRVVEFGLISPAEIERRRHVANANPTRANRLALVRVLGVETWLRYQATA